MEKKELKPRRPKAIDRRAFLKLSGLLGLGLASTSLVPRGAEAVRFNRRDYKVSKARLAMGTFVSMTLIHPSRDQAEEAMGLAFEEVELLTRSMSRFDTATAVSRLNQEGVLKDLPPELLKVISTAINYYHLSHGGFDITVQPVVDLFRDTFARGENKPPSRDRLEQVLGLVGCDMVELRGRSIRFKKPGMGITLDGIAKGYIVDRASNILDRHHIENHLINAGGDIRARGLRQDKRPWAVAIQDPQKKKHYPDVIQLNDGAIATSGNYEVYFDREKMFHHIVDPKTGRSPVLSDSVSVTAKTAMDADALSTSVFVMRPLQGTKFIDTLAGCECFVLAKGGRKIKSAGWKGSAT